MQATKSQPNASAVTAQKETQDQTMMRAARDGSMSVNRWDGNGVIRYYLRRTNAARTEAGYIEFFERDGKKLMRTIVTATGTGSRTCASEVETVRGKYKAMRAEINAAKSV